MGFVPAFFRALASDPDGLTKAWEHAVTVRDDPRSAESARRLRETARAHIEYKPSPEVRSAVGGFLRELPFMLLVVESLCLTIGEMNVLGGREHVPSVIEALAEKGLLDEPQRAIVPFLDSVDGQALIAHVERAARQEAGRYGASAPKLERAEPTLAEFRRTLPRTLAFVVAASRE